MYTYTYTHKKEKQYWGWGWERVSQVFAKYHLYSSQIYRYNQIEIYICPHYKVENKDKKKDCLNEYFKNDEARS